MSESSVRDQGFRPYTGVRLPAANNTWVLWRHGLSRALKSWIVRIAIVASVGPLLIALVAFAFMGWVATQNPGQVQPPDLVRFVRDLLRAELWLSGAAIGFGAGATAISDDAARHALPFFFAKPVSAGQYWLGRAGAIFTLVALTLLLPVLVFVPLAIALDQNLPKSAALVLFPAALGALICAAAVSTLAIGISALSESRALTTSLFASLWLLPHVLAALASVFADGSWPFLISVPAQLTFVLESLLHKSEEPDGPTALHALPLLLGLCVLCFRTALTRLERARGST